MMKKLLNLLILFSIGALLSGCPQGGTNGGSGKGNGLGPAIGQKLKGFGSKVKGLFKKGDIAGAVNEQVSPPRCASRDSIGSDKDKRKRGSSKKKEEKKVTRAPIELGDYGKVHIIAGISNTSCLAKEAKSGAAKRLGIRVAGANSSERKALDGYASLIERLMGKKAARGVASGGVYFQKNLRLRRNGNCLPGINGAHTFNGKRVYGIHVGRRCHPNSHNSKGGKAIPNQIGYVVHEMAHKFASYYSRRYTKATKVCKVSGYSTHKAADKSGKRHAHGHRGEEFAEVISAYLTATDRLKSLCPDAYKFLRDNIFNKDKSYSCSGKRKGRLFQDRSNGYFKTSIDR